jgi:ribonuclease HII
MIMAGVLIDNELEKEFRKLGVRDSKRLTALRREVLAEIIKKKALAFHIKIISPSEIDGRTNAGINLNRIEALKSGEIINKINRGLDKIRVVVDCPSPNISRWRNILKTYIKNPKNLEIICEHKADANHIAVSAASILAKSTREKEVKKIKRRLGVEFGSGYSSDPITKQFLEQYAKKHKKNGIFRQTWSTWKNNNAKKEQKKLKDFKN